MRAIAVLAALLCGAFSSCAMAQVAPEPAAVAPVVVVPVSAAESPAPAADPCADCITIPPLTVVAVEIMVDLGSKISKSGDMFPIRLASPILIDGRVVVPAGATGMGEVIHAKKSGGSGAAGELVLAARYVEVDGRRLRLRSMQMVANGRSNIGMSTALSVAGGAGGSLLGLIIKGKQAIVPAGTIADAKTAEAFTLVPPPAPVPEAAAAPEAAPEPVPAPQQSFQ